MVGGRTVLIDTDGNKIVVSPSSGMLVIGPDGKQYKGPFVWLTIYPRDGKEAYAHLNYAMVRELHAALDITMEAR